MRLDKLFDLEPGTLEKLRDLPLNARYSGRKVGKRDLLIPCGPLKAAQRDIARVLSRSAELHPAAHGYRRGRSVLTNAGCHIHKEFVLGLDFTSFFRSIPETLVARHLAERFEMTARDADLMANLCCFLGYLPEGAPTSPFLSNLVCVPLDRDMQAVSDAFGCTYTRYSDDMSFSTHAKRFPKVLATQEGGARCRHTTTIGDALSSVFEKHGFAINNKKSRLQSRSDEQVVTGLLVNNGINLRKADRAAIQDALRIWKMHGLRSAAWLHSSGNVQRFGPRLKGRIEYVAQVRGRADPLYRRFRDEYDRLAALEPPAAASKAFPITLSEASDWN